MGTVTPSEPTGRYRAPITTGKATVSWSADGTTVTKRYGEPWATPVLGSTEASFHNELRVNRLLLREPPPVRSPRLLRAGRRHRDLVFAAVSGAPIGEKYPATLSPCDLHAAMTVATKMDGYRPRRRWFFRLPLADHLALFRATGLIDDGSARAIATAVEEHPWRFAHADLTPRNLIRDEAGGVWLIDWEWAGVYPLHYDRAFLWFSLVQVEGGRARVEAAVPADEMRAFRAAVALVQLRHLQMWAERGVSRDAPACALHRHDLSETLAKLLGHHPSTVEERD